MKLFYFEQHIAFAGERMNVIDSESIVRKEMDLANGGISCSGKVRISLSIV